MNLTLLLELSKTYGAVFVKVYSALACEILAGQCGPTLVYRCILTLR